MTVSRGIRLIIAAAIVAILAILLLWHLWQRSRSAATEAKLGRTQAEASVASGRDALDTLGNSHDREAAIDEITRNNADAIRSAEGAHAPVADPVRDAGLAGLCGREAYRRDPRCLQFTPAR